MKERLFALKKTEEKDCEESAVRFQLESEINYQQEGFREAGRHDGSVTSLRICLQKIYRTSIDRISRDVEEQEKRKRGLREKVEDRKGENVQLSSDSEEISSKKIPALREKIGRLKEELSYIRQNPHEIIGDEAGRAGFFIGCIILLFLTVYLFVFYSSATYSTFFKEFTLNEIGVASSIFDPDALTLAYEQGVTELILLLTIPFIFLGLGYLIHEFKKKYFRIALLILVTFIFDAILGYEITAKIYNITRENSFETLPEYTIPMAFQSVSFWLIIFAGFLVYLIWGFVFGFVMEAYTKLDKVQVALHEKKREISEAERGIDRLNARIEDIAHKMSINMGGISRLEKDIAIGTVISGQYPQREILGFSAGWLSWMKQAGKRHEEVDIAARETHDFIESMKLKPEIITE